LAAVLFLGGCRGDSNTNTNLATNMNAATPMMADTAAQATVKDALEKAGFNDVTVTATTTEVTLRGSVPNGKLGEAVRIATEKANRKVNNQLTEK
jgi:osmotically-inducible protein OsmY